jgi:hypothetical protein
MTPVLTRSLLAGTTVLAFALAGPAAAGPFSFDSGLPDGLMATGSRPASAGKIEIESADDFIAPAATTLTSASFTGLVTGTTPIVGNVVVEIYRVFPLDSTSPPAGTVPTRVNSPADVAFAERDAAAGNLSFSLTTLGASLTAANTVLNGINPVPNQSTGGEGLVTGREVRFDITLTVPIDLPADHYFFVPQVEVAGGEFWWLSAPRPIAAPGTPIVPDLQSWIRNENLAPDWLRVGTDITQQGPFNASFSLAGRTADTAVPEPATLALLAGGLGLLAWRRRRR